KNVRSRKRSPRRKPPVANMSRLRVGFWPASKLGGAMDDDTGDIHEPSAVPDGAEIRILEIVNKKGLHAPPSAKFCQIDERFDAEVRGTRGNETVGGRSIMGLMMLGAGIGTKITIAATGNEATAAADALEKLVASGFGEED